VSEKFDRLAGRYSEHDYADPGVYAERRADVIATLGPRLDRNALVLDLACGDGVMGPPLAAKGFRYVGVDASAAMIEASAARHPDLRFELGTLDQYEPTEPVDCTICLRAFYYAADRAAFFARVRTFTHIKLVFDVRPQVYDVAAIRGELAAAGFTSVTLRPFLLPQSRRVPALLRKAVYGLERSGPIARLILRRYGSYFCSACVGDGS
jgi:SAM-dependent methyltransferase